MLTRYLGPTADDDETPNIVRADQGMVFAYNNLEGERDRLRVENRKLKAEIEKRGEMMSDDWYFRPEIRTYSHETVQGFIKERDDEIAELKAEIERLRYAVKYTLDIDAKEDYKLHPEAVRLLIETLSEVK